MADAISANDPDLAPPLDQIFGMLQREYTPGKIEREVATVLRTRTGAHLACHEIVLRLSTDAKRNPLVVTTNFDLLFERARKGIRGWSPPMLPQISGDHSPSGVVYLHGRLPTTSDQRRIPAMVLGSSDFGRAYLADGWATTFIRQLLERRVVVLLGYSANDPPVRYLLEGLHASTSVRTQRIYAFDRGEDSEVRARWTEGLGVEAMPFREFPDLWKTLELWAARADDPDAWRGRVVLLAQTSPRDLQPFERGQVATLVATADGAKAFAEADPPPTSEWLCVFDKYARFGKPANESWEPEAPIVDPHDLYGLDDDPPRPDVPEVEAKIEGLDPLATLPADDVGRIYTRLSGVPRQQQTPNVRRLWSLARWFEHVADQPPAIWWCARQRFLHPDLLWGVNRRLSGHGKPFDDVEWKLWSLLFEIMSQAADDIHDLGWFDFRARLGRSGWTNSAFRGFETAIQPRLEVEPIFLRSPVPPRADSEVDSRSLLHFRVRSPSRHGAEVQIPDSALAAVFRIVRTCLERTVRLLEDAGQEAQSFRLPALEPVEGPGERVRHRLGPEADFLWAVRLFDRLSELSPEEAKAEVASWLNPDEYFFDKFRIHAWRKKSLFEASAVAEGLGGLPVTSFWKPYLARELLHLLRERWDELSLKERKHIEARILLGPQRYPHEDNDEQYDTRKAHSIGTRLGWLQSNGSKLSGAAIDSLRDYRKRSDWRREWERSADRDWEGRSGWIEQRKDPRSLAELPISSIIQKAREESTKDRENFVEFLPFAGLVQASPLRALSALACESRRNQHPIGFWQQLLSEWPRTAPKRLTRLCGLRIANLPQGIVFELRFYISGWIRRNLPGLFPERDSWAIWDSVFEKLMNAGEQATESGVGEISLGGRLTQRSRKTLDYAINGPVGDLVESLFDGLGERKFKRKERLPSNLVSRLERTLSAVGEGADHAACLLGQRVDWLYFVDPEWTKQAILPQFDLGSPRSEAAWNGLLFGARVPQSSDLFHLIKKSFLAVFETRPDWLEADNLERSAAQFLVIATYWSRKDERYLTSAESRRALQSMNDNGREAALWMLGDIVEKQRAWRSFGKRFLSEVWPQEARFQTSGTSDMMIRIAEDLPELFPGIVKVIKEYLRPSDHPDLHIFRYRRTMDGAEERATLAKRWPLQVLEIVDRIVPLEPAYPPHDLAELLAEIAEQKPSARATESWRRLRDIVAK